MKEIKKSTKLKDQHKLSIKEYREKYSVTSGLSEGTIQKAILRYLTILEKNGDIYFIRNNSFEGKIIRKDGSFGYIKNNKLGTPDIICGLKVLDFGIMVGIELKSEKGTQSDNQIKAQSKIEKVKGYYFIARSIDDVKNSFELIKKDVKEKSERLSGGYISKWF